MRDYFEGYRWVSQEDLPRIVIGTHEYDEKYGLSPTFSSIVEDMRNEGYLIGQEIGTRAARVRAAGALVIKGYEDNYIYKLTQVTPEDLERCRKEAEEGMKKGREKIGTEKSLTKVALEMLKENTPIDFIAKVTGLDIETIQKLKDTIQQH